MIRISSSLAAWLLDNGGEVYWVGLRPYLQVKK